MIVAVLLFGCTEEEDVPKPSWWVEPEDEEIVRGVKWPPPKPEGWDDPWPPDEPQRSDVQFWVDYFRDKQADGSDDPTRQANVTKNGEVGSEGFYTMFPLIVDTGSPDRCGLFSTTNPKQRAMANCDPYPGAVIAGLCARALTVTEAQEQCRDGCIENNRCDQSRLYEPEIWVRWMCGPRDGQPQFIDATCNASYVCECYED